MNFTPLAFIDPFDMIASLPTRLGLFGKGEGLRQITVRGPRPGGDPDDDLAFAYYKRAMWPEMKAMLERIKRLGEGVGGVEFGRITLDLLPAGVVLPWAEPDLGEYTVRFVRSHLALRTNPGVITYSGSESMHLPSGMLALVNQRVWTATANHGETAMIRLALDTRKKE